MVNNHIRVYARIKKESNGHKSRYEVVPDENGYDIMKIYHGGSSFKRKRRAFRFNKVFQSNSTQEDIFNVIAKPIIQDVFSGINATIFAYGATGSGKTYTLTGSQYRYDDRGLIPRTIEYLFQVVTDNMSNYMFFISYLEIYNENAYDLLNPKQNFTCLEELPRVIVLEDEKGEAHFKNLCLKEVNTEKEAMRLLYSGDNNRTIAETPLNDYSSRSHCVFTVHVISKCNMTGHITRSKLNLVDLAGSERLHRMNLRGMTLNEARHINLSLHYLERVIQALSAKGTHHVPYRNSMMTFILRDSLGGNCLTAMLATLSMLHLNVDESISTCKFAQRVCLITLQANINYVPTPEKEIHYLRNELKRLKRQMHEKEDVNKKLSRDEENECKTAVKQYLLGKEDLVKLNDISNVKYYLEFMRDKLIKVTNQLEMLNSRNTLVLRRSPTKNFEKMEKKYKQIIEQKDEEIGILMNFYTQRVDPTTLFSPMSSDSFTNSLQMNTMEKNEFQQFLNNSKHKPTFDDCVNQVKLKYNEAVKIAQTLSTKQKQIASVKDVEDKNNLNADVRLKLALDRNFYREQLHKMHKIREEIEDLKSNMNSIKSKIMEDYKLWCFLDSTRQAKGNNKTVGSTDEAISFSFDKSIEDEKCLVSKTYSSKNSCLDPVPQKKDENITSPLNDSTPKSIISNLNSMSTENLILRKGTGVQLDRSRNFLNIPQEHALHVKSNLIKKIEENPYKSSSFVGSLQIGPTLKSKDNVHLSEVILEYPKCQETRRSRSPRTVKNHLKSPPRNNLNLSLVQCKSADCINHKREEVKIGKEKKSSQPSCYQYVQPDDSAEFVAYLKSIPLTGDEEVDEEIIKFYRLKYKRNEIKLLHK